MCSVKGIVGYPGQITVTTGKGMNGQACGRMLDYAKREEHDHCHYGPACNQPRGSASCTAPTIHKPVPGGIIS